MKSGLKSLSPEGVPGALAEAQRYPLLNKPREAAGIRNETVR
jgi:hypothetical protein